MNLLRGFLLTVCLIVSLSGWCVEPFYPRYGAKEARADLAGFRPQLPDTLQFMCAIRLGRYHVYKPGEYKADLDSAYSYYLTADKISRRLKSPKIRAMAINLLGSIYYERAENARAMSLHEEAAGIAREIGDLSLEAESWYLRGEVKPYLENGSAYVVNPFYEKSAETFRKAQNVQYQAYVLTRIGGIQNYYLQDYKKAFTNLLEAERLYKSVRYPRMHYVYDQIADVSRSCGMYGEALRYGLLAVESARKSNDRYELSSYLMALGKVYEELEERSRAIECYKQGVAESMSDEESYGSVAGANAVARILLKDGKFREAKNYFTPIFAKYPPSTPNEKFIQWHTLSQYYVHSGRYDVAENYIRKLLAIEDSIAIVDINIRLHQSIGSLYLKAGRFNLARRHFVLANKWITESKPQEISYAIEIQKGLYKLDSSQGNHAMALEHYRRHKELSDSVSSIKKSLQIAGIQVQFDVKQKEQDIQALTQQNKAQLARLEQRELQRNAMIGGTTLLSFLLLSLYVQFRNKQKSNQELKLHQQVIEDSNAQLTRTVEEKQMLVREIHHRVKNNLQTVISLLESQAFYLENDALTAVKDSQNRIHAMSLIHQKLYLADNITSINMQAYIQELVTHLGSSHPDSRICIDLQVDFIYLDVAQAIPLGLIINEAVTNVFKYAFPGGLSGEMHIQFHETPEGQYMLNISDNGIGLHHEVDQARPSSLGMKLMKGLSHEMGAQFQIASEQGVRITVRFAPLQPYL